ncbi:MAG: GMC oxidoreductase [Janthinobacterium lividum]
MLDEARTVIVGSGPSGIAVADTLRLRGFSSLILEAGATRAMLGIDGHAGMAEYRRALAPRLHVDERDWHYEADRSVFDWIRVRSPGGRSLRWGGWLAKPKLENFLLHGASRAEWPFARHELDRLFVRSAAWLGARTCQLDPIYAALSQTSGTLVTPKVAAVSRGGILPFCALDRLAAADGAPRPRAHVDLFDQAVATRVMCGRNGVEGIEYVDRRDAKTHRRKAAAVVLAASPIETTRLLLCSDLAALAPIRPSIGRHYLDHIAASYLAILPYRHVGEACAGVMQRGAIIERPNDGQADIGRGGFTLELHGPNAASIHEPEILAAAELDPRADAQLACVSINAIGELLASPSRWVGLSTARDALGRPAPRIAIGWHDDDLALAARMEAEAERIALLLAGKHGRAVKVRRTLTLGGTGTSHEAGTCRIGFRDSESVVDRHGQVHGIKGLYVADASLMPSGLDCHPTLTVVALAMNTADGLARFLSAQ